MFIRWNRVGKNRDRHFIDTDFEETVEDGSLNSVWPIIVQLYERRNLPVAPNLLKAMMWWKDECHFRTLQSIINANKRYKHWEKYKEEIEKYLLLL
jgi:hypothetical protein